MHTGERREGLYTGYLVFLRKFATGVLVFGAGQLLNATGYISSTTGSLFIEQPQAALNAMRFMVTIVPAITLALSLKVLAWRFPLDRETHGRSVANWKPAAPIRRLRLPRRWEKHIRFGRSAKVVRYKPLPDHDGPGRQLRLRFRGGHAPTMALTAPPNAGDLIQRFALSTSNEGVDRWYGDIPPILNC